MAYSIVTINEELKAEIRVPVAVDDMTTEQWRAWTEAISACGVMLAEFQRRE